MEETGSNVSDLQFKESQIICLEYEDTKLYGEVIQLIHHRRMCWFRPICMTMCNFEDSRDSADLDLIHLQSSSDLLWPTSLFRPALDTEVISLLTDTDTDSKTNKGAVSSKQHLNQFVKRVWRANQDKF
ncbi:MAG: hypothetical protein AAGE96_03845 [Cyanobacteria bacterium P01_G01_bin.19]